MSKTFAFGERVEKSSENKYGFDLLYRPNGDKNPVLKEVSLLGQKSIIVLPGNGTNSTKSINGCCKVAEHMLLEAGMKPEDLPHLYGLGYFKDNETDNHRYRLLTESGENKFSRGKDNPQNPTAEENYWIPFFQEYLLPLIEDNDGQTRSEDEIKKNFQNVTFLTHCHGGALAYQLEKMLFEKLNTIYPQKSNELMGNLRMMHFSSRRPLKQDFGSKHFHIIAQNDGQFADSGVLEQDNLHMQIHMGKIDSSSMLLPIKKQEEILVVKKVDVVPSDNPDIDEVHSGILGVFSSQDKEKTQDNLTSIKFTQKLFRYFVEHPEDSRELRDILKDQNSSFVSEQEQIGKVFLQKVKDREKINRGLLTILSNASVNFSGVKTLDKEVLFERNDEGKFLYNQLLENYKQTGNSQSLISCLKNIYAGEYSLDSSVIDTGRLLSLQKKDWNLFHAYGPFGNYGQEDKILHVLQMISPENLTEILPEMTLKIDPELRKKGTYPETCLSYYPQAIHQLIVLSKKIKNSSKRLKVENFIRKAVLDISSRGSYKNLLKMSSISERKEIKAYLSEKRSQKADSIIQLMRSRDQKSPKARLKEILTFNRYTANQFGIDGFNLYQEEKRQNPDLKYNDFLKKHGPGR